MNDNTINIISSALTLIGLFVALLIALFQEKWRKSLQKPKLGLSNELNYWIETDKNKSNPKKWHRIKIKNTGKSTTHHTIIKITNICVGINKRLEEINLDYFPLPTTLIWGSVDSTYQKALSPNEYEYINLFYTKEKSYNLFFPLRNKDDGDLTIDLKGILQDQISTTLQFAINIYSDDLVDTLLFNIQFDALAKNNHPPIITNLVVSNI